jgi:hypothetical protein
MTSSLQPITGWSEDVMEDADARRLLLSAARIGTHRSHGCK